jgi:hypothetical protein
LRSSGNIEQFVIEDNEELYNFNKEYQDRIIEKYKTINKTIRSQQLWQQVETAGAQAQTDKQGQADGQ